MSADDISSVRFSVRKSRKSITTAVQPRRKIGPLHLMTTDQKSDLKKAFDSFDVNGVGWIGIEELRVAVRALGYEPKMEDMRTLMATIDRDGKGKISFADFLYLMALKMSEHDSKEDISKSFRLIDVNGTNKIRFKDIKRVAELLGEDLNDEQLQEMIREADTDNDRAVTLDDFIKITKKFEGLQVLASSM